jgi:hydroxymethylpyrimidine pyrophosphatase-like HAD family hydrolase
MGNGQDAAKAAADYIGLPNDQNGVADACIDLF